MRRLHPILLSFAALLIACPAPEVDPDDITCHDPDWTPGACAAGTIASHAVPNGAASHVDGDIDYPERPPSAGSHNPQWARYGEYEFLPPERWIHNLEHGAAAFLYHPCAPEDLVQELRDYARARPDDDGGAFRWVLTPYGGLPSAIAVVTWGEVYSAECVDPADIDAFLDEHYRDAPEDVAGDGSFEDLWLTD